MPTPSFHLYLDDSGTRYPDHRTSVRSDGVDHFALGGLLIRSELVEQAISAHTALASQYELSGPFHSNSIRVQKDAFAWLEHDRERASRFYTDLENILCGLPGYATGCIIHRPGYNARYSGRYGSGRWDLCKSAYTIVVERAVKFAARYSRRLIVYVEQTGKKEDRAIRQYHGDLRAAGMYFDANNSSKYAPLGGDAFKETLLLNPNFINKGHPLAQLADLLLYPLVKGRYTPSYVPYQRLIAAGRIIDSMISVEDIPHMGVKYYCFNEI